MKRGEIWTVAGDKDDAEKPRPLVILQDDRFDVTNSITMGALPRTRPMPLCFAYESSVNVMNVVNIELAHSPCQSVGLKLAGPTVAKSMLGIFTLGSSPTQMMQPSVPIS